MPSASARRKPGWKSGRRFQSPSFAAGSPMAPPRRLSSTSTSGAQPPTPWRSTGTSQSVAQ
eukprot:6627783-Lingulodinium_polyedra.AAC.1